MTAVASAHSRQIPGPLICRYEIYSSKWNNICKALFTWICLGPVAVCWGKIQGHVYALKAHNWHHHQKMCWCKGASRKCTMMCKTLSLCAPWVICQTACIDGGFESKNHQTKRMGDSKSSRKCDGSKSNERSLIAVIRHLNSELTALQDKLREASQEHPWGELAHTGKNIEKLDKHVNRCKLIVQKFILSYYISHCWWPRVVPVHKLQLWDLIQ